MRYLKGFILLPINLIFELLVIAKKLENKNKRKLIIKEIKQWKES